MARVSVIALGAALASACIARERLVCDGDPQCSLRDGGVCIDGGCAYPDDACDSQLRYSDYAGERAGECVEPPAVADSGSDEATTIPGDGSSSDAPASTGEASSGDGTTGDDTTGDVPSPCDGIACSDAGACVVIDGAPSCACDRGLWMLGLECVLDPCDQVSCFYLDAELGDDAADGSIDTPWRTLGRLSSAVGDASPGDHFLLRRGQQWGDEDGGFRLELRNVAGTPEAPVVVGAYGPLADGRPRIEPGNVRILASSYVVLRDLHVQDDPASEVLEMLYGSRPCVMVQSSDHVTVVDNEISDCVARGIWVGYGSSYTAIVDNSLRRVDNDGITISDITWEVPAVRVGPHHWVLDNVVEAIESTGIVFASSTTEFPIGDVKLVRNLVADTGASGVVASTTGYAWVVDNVVARAGGIDSWRAGVVAIGERAQLSGNIAFEGASHGILVDRTVSATYNTVIHDGTNGDAMMVDDGGSISGAHNLLWARGGALWLDVWAAPANEHVTALDDSWYVGDDAGACRFGNGGTELDLAGWRRATGFDLASSCGPVPGFGDFTPALPLDAWDDALWDAFVPDASWSGCADPVGARDCDGAPIGPPIAPLAGFEEEDGLGWTGPLLVRQRYDIFAQ